MSRKLSQIIIYVLLMVQFGCDQNRWKVDTSGIELALNIQRFDLDLLKYSEDGISETERQKLMSDYPHLMPLYMMGIMKFGMIESAESWQQLETFLLNEDIKYLFSTVEDKYPQADLKAEADELTEAFKRYLFHFPNFQVPALKTMVSAFNYSVATGDSLLIIGLDNYLGSDFPIYAQAGIPQYKFKQFSREYLVSDALKAWLTTEFESKGGQNMLEQMIFQGKILFLLEALMPEKEKHLFFNYTPEELEWCQTNESEIWFHFVDMDLLYTNESHTIRKYLGDAPFIAGFPEGSPGRVGQWIGYRIVKSYMEKNSDQNLADLMQIEQANQILQQSNYKPKR